MELIEQRIKANIHHFDLLALLRLLRHSGYSTIWFSSHDSITSEQRVIEDIKFSQTAVVISLNLGLLSPQSPLPDYILRLRDTLTDRTDDFKNFIGYFDHVLLQQLVFGLYPECHKSAFNNWARYQNNILSLTNLKSVRSIHMLFNYVYPECVVKVQRNTHIKAKSLEKRVLGKVTTGFGYHLGDVGFAKAKGVLVMLQLQEQDLEILEIQRRLIECILPLLSSLSLHLEVSLQGLISPLKTRTSNKATPLGFHPLNQNPLQGKVSLFFGQTNRSGICV